MLFAVHANLGKNAFQNEGTLSAAFNTPFPVLFFNREEEIKKTKEMAWSFKGSTAAFCFFNTMNLVGKVPGD